MLANLTPPCRICRNSDGVICYPDDYSLTVCPVCCEKAEHPDGEIGHVWVHNPHIRGYECDKCGIDRNCTNYLDDYIDRG